MKFINLNNNNRIIKRTKSYLYLILSISFMSIFVVYIAPYLDDLQYVKPVTCFIDEREIDAGALYYTDVEEFSIAEINMKNTIDYRPLLNSNIKRVKK